MHGLTIEKAIENKPSNTEIVAVMAKYGITAKQAGFALATMANPHASETERARIAGYTDSARTGDGGRVIKSDSITKTLTAMTEERAEIERKSKELVRAIQSDARGAVRNKLAEHVNDPNITPNQTRSLELLGKMEGVFIERLEIDAGEHTRQRYAENLAQESAKVSEEIDL